MPNTATKIDDLLASRLLRKVGVHPSAEDLASPWAFSSLTGYLVEISSGRAAAAVSAAFSLLLEAQRKGETTAWLSDSQSSFFPPDVAEGGVDLSALVLVRLDRQQDVAVAADKLVRSGAFGMVVIDLSPPPGGRPGASARGTLIPAPLQSRLAGLARKHSSAVVILTGEGTGWSSLGPMISMNIRAERRLCPVPPRKHRQSATGLALPTKVKESSDDAHQSKVSTFGDCDQHHIVMTTIRDKRGVAAGQEHMEPCRGPAGMR